MARRVIYRSERIACSSNQHDMQARHNVHHISIPPQQTVPCML